ncbi:MAG TPA: hypothetical protein PKM65_00695 [Spirochaetota bacterium]|nr:hypothetical protein [Spirochaetota bacterium]HNT11664.1 hypothetical protein [Spirochaetota bacterium]
MSQLFDRSALVLKPLNERTHDLDLSVIRNLEPVPDRLIDDSIRAVARAVVRARKTGSSVIFMMGAHVLRSGVQRYLIDLMSSGHVTCVAMNGAGIIHDYEFALIGATTESVARYISEGQFGLWRETGRINDIVSTAWRRDPGCGLGEAVGREIAGGGFPHADVSVFAAGYRLGIPVTAHVGIGYDIIHEHPNFDGAATGALSYNDFLRFAGVVSGLEGGVVMNFGSAIMAPEVYLKALSMARNVAHRRGSTIRCFTTLVCDLHDLPDDFRSEPGRGSAAYYFRPWKTMLARTVADGGTSHYVMGRHEATIPALWTVIHRYGEEGTE